MLRNLPRRSADEFVFVNPETGDRYKEIQGAVERARDAAGLDGVWTHDLRRSFITNARRAGIPQRVIMSMSGHLTDAAFSATTSSRRRTSGERCSGSTSCGLVPFWEE